MSFTCEQLEETYKTLTTKNQEIVVAWQRGILIKDFTHVKKLKKEIEELISTLQQMLWPFEYLEKTDLEGQYEFQKNVLKELGIIESLPSGELGIKAVNNQEYPFPTFNEIKKMARENREVLCTKSEQGFNQLLIVPFGMRLDDLIEKCKDLLWKHYKEKKLFRTMERKEDVPVFPDDLPFGKDIVDKIKSREIRYEEIWEDNRSVYKQQNSAIWVWDKYQHSDLSRGLVYYPQEFSDNHHGKTKQEILEAQVKTPGAGFNIIFIEDLPNIPRTNPENKGGRIQLDTQGSSIKKYIAPEDEIPSPSEYLQAINIEPMYRHEIGMTPEDQLIYTILYLTKHNQVVDDFKGRGSISYQIGAYYPDFGNALPYSFWRSDFMRMVLSGVLREHCDEQCGVRTAVKILKS